MEALNQNAFGFFFNLAHQNPLFDELIVFLAKYVPYLLIVGFLVFLLSKKDGRARLFILIEGLLAVIISRSVITEAIRFFYDHPRPFATLNTSPLVEAVGNSFPSGHAVTFFSIAMIVYFFNKRLGIWFFVFACLNGVARIVAGVHWPFDILGGAIVGILSGHIAHALSKDSWEKMAQPTAQKLSDPQE